MSWTLQIDHADGETRELAAVEPDALGDPTAPSVATLSYQRRLDRRPDEADEAEVAVYRDAWTAVVDDIDPRNDEFQIVAPGGSVVFGGRLRDHEFDGVVVSVLLDGPKRDAIDGEISGPAVGYDPQPDDDLVAAILGRTPTIDAGAIEGQKIIPFSESNAAPGKSITKLAQATGAETIYRPDFSLDYVGRLGDDRSDETLSPTAGTVISEPRIRRDDREAATHVTVLGAGEGTAQVRETAVVDSFEAGGRRIDRLKPDKDITRGDQATALAAEIAAEIEAAPRHLDVEFEIPASVNPALGDTFHVELAQYGIAEDLRIMELTRILDEAGDRFNAILSSRKLTRESKGDQSARELSALNEGNAGQYFFNTQPEGWDLVADQEPFEFEIFYPEDVIDEFEASLRVKSQPYRARVVGGGHEHIVDIDSTSAANSDFANVVEEENSLQILDIDNEDGWVDLDPGTGPLSPSSPTAAARGFAAIRLFGDPEETPTHEYELRWRNKSTGATYPTNGFRVSMLGEGGGERASFFGEDPTDCQGEDLMMQINRRTSGGETSLLYSVYYWAVGTHNHPIEATETTESASDFEPGVNTFSDQTVSDVSIKVNDQTVASGLNAPLSEPIDISDVLSPGANSLTATSESLGELHVTVVVEGLRNATSNS